MDAIQELKAVETSRPPRRRVARLVGATLTACALLAGSLGLTAPAPAQAAPIANHSYTFTAPTGEDWVVPDGVTEVFVGLRGGDGGCVRCDQPGGEGKSYLLQVDVQPGDTLTLYAGQTAGDYSRTAGKGFVDGGKGGDKSRSAMSGNGGGGAAALKRNGELIAVAGGGGGGGGRGGDREFRPFSYDFDFGGGGGDASTGAKPTWGEGKHAGNPGKNGVDDPAFARYGKSGENGKDAGFMTSGGGGGAGGGGWPSSGTASGAGKKRLGFGAGSGGGAGMSWLAPESAGVAVLSDGAVPNVEFTYVGPLAKRGTVQVTVPVQVRTELSLVGEGVVGTDFELRAHSFDMWITEPSVDGTFELLQDGTKIASGATGGELRVPVSGLEPGTYTFTYRFVAKQRFGDYWDDAARTVSELVVTVGAPDSNAAITPDDSEQSAGDAVPNGSAAAPDGAPSQTRTDSEAESDRETESGSAADTEGESGTSAADGTDACIIDEPLSDDIRQH